MHIALVVTPEGERVVLLGFIFSELPYEQSKDSAMFGDPFPMALNLMQASGSPVCDQIIPIMAHSMEHLEAALDQAKAELAIPANELADRMIDPDAQAELEKMFAAVLAEVNAPEEETGGASAQF